MIVGQSDVHDRSRNNLRSFYDRTDFRGMHAENCTLRHVYYWSSHHGAEDTSVCDGESTTREVLQSDLAIASFQGKISETLLKVSEAIVLAIAHYGHNETCWGRDSSADVDEVTVNHLVVIDDSVDDWLLLERLHRGLHESAHEAELHTMFLHKGILNFLTHIDKVSHINFVESGEKSIGVLSLFQAASDRLAHLAHLDTSLNASSSDLRGSLLGSLLSS